MIKLKDIIKESKWSDRKWGDPLPTLEDYMPEAVMKLKPKGGGKTVVFKDKDNYDKAKSSGKYIDPDSTKGDDDKPSDKFSGGDYERDFDDDPDDIDNLDTALDDDPTRGDPDDSWDDEEGRAKPKGKTDADTDDDDFHSKGMDKASDLAKQGMGGDTGTDADFQGEPPEGAREPDDEGEPDFYDPEDYEKIYPDKTKPKDEVGDIKYGKGFSPDSDHMFDSVANSAPDASDKYSGMVDSAKSGNWEKFRAGIHDIYDEDAREHLLNLANHVDAGTYKSEFPSGKKGLKFGRKEVMDMFRQAAEYGDEQFGGDEDEDDLEDPAGGKGDAWMHGKSEESITINGKQYKRISESVEPTVFDPFKEAKKQLGGLYTRMKGK